MRTPTNERVSSDISEPVQARDFGPAQTCPSQRGSEPSLRRCVISGESGAREAMIRLALSPDGDILPDVQAKAPGRGAWIGVSKAALTEALGNGALKAGLARAFKIGKGGPKLAIAQDLPEKIEAALRRAVLDRLGLELRAGFLCLGSQRIADTARSGQIALLAHALDARHDGMSKLDQAWRVGNDKEGSGLRGLRLPLDRDTLSVALGRENVVHLGLVDPAAAKRVRGILDKLIAFLDEPPPDDRTACERVSNEVSAE